MEAIRAPAPMIEVVKVPKRNISAPYIYFEGWRSSDGAISEWHGTKPLNIVNGCLSSSRIFAGSREKFRAASLVGSSANLFPSYCINAIEN
jgi:hypothetical protein